MKLPTGFQLIGQVVRIRPACASAAPCWRLAGPACPVPPQGLPDYTKWLTRYSTKKQDDPAEPITCRSYARYGSPGKAPVLLAASRRESSKVSAVCRLPRVGLMGNPSDGFNGKTVAMSISNFWAEVTLVESQTLVTPACSDRTRPLPPRASELVSPGLFAGAAPSPAQRPHGVWKPAGLVLHQQERRVRPTESWGGGREAPGLTAVSLPPPAGTWEVCGCCRPPVRSSISSAPNKGRKHRPVVAPRGRIMRFLLKIEG